jgi:hypothetical protein
VEGLGLDVAIDCTSDRVKAVLGGAVLGGAIVGIYAFLSSK